ncbi:hypothetical protein CFOL_v3_23724 [Cephalotus follicularis]|uniref:PWWP domain-containing protein n=1 Tax=Cephalotus follicularis TaxID=3775 RepID=A0A1Q3CJL5_CEPFO|nr:hypothetical protein CFOL_v3_23724 [Cephalotus follicularis]
MGNPSPSSEEPNKNGIDSSVGGLVWVRRRNGSWWPGRIMSLDEVTEGCVISPRSGTPVKLLGREDASVDWYNLEKSKRVKAFRCGEYEECIAKAKVAAANAGKKVVKYARREDAILHALELESARLGKNHPDYFSRTDNSGGEPAKQTKESPSMSHSAEGCEDISGDGKRRRTPNDSEDDGSEGIKRMRGLEDLGMGVGSTRKFQVGGVLEQVQPDGTSLCESNTGNFVSNGSPVYGGKVYSSSLKRKRSQVANVHEFLKRKNRRRPLTKVLESTAMVSVPVMCDQLANSNGAAVQGISDSKVTVIQSKESRKSCSTVINNNLESTGISYEEDSSLLPDTSHINHKIKENEISGSSGLAENGSCDRLFDVPFVGEEKHSGGFSPVCVSCSNGRPQTGALGRQSSQGSQVEAVSLRHDGIIESGSTSLASVRVDKGTSKWQLKGKRNSRHTSKSRKLDSTKYVDMDDESNAYSASLENSDGFPQRSDQKANGIGGPLGSYNCALQAMSIPVTGDEGHDLRDMSKSISSREPHMRGLAADGSVTPQRTLPYRQPRFTVHPRYQTPEFSGRNFCIDSKLYDVKLEVKASYRPQHVPLVSLMSKLNGKAIVGHPLTVYVLDDGYCDLMLSGIDFDASHLSTPAAAETGYASKRNYEARRIPAKNMTSEQRYALNKSPKLRKCGLLSKKTRKLSTLTGQRQYSEERKLVVEKPKGPVIACIPLKLVFSRINEAVNGSSRATHRALTSCNS